MVKGVSAFRDWRDDGTFERVLERLHIQQGIGAQSGGTACFRRPKLFVSRLSTYVLNRLGLNALHLLNRNHASEITALDPGTVRYFQRLPGYDTLGLVLAKKFVLVEGPSDEIIFERMFYDVYELTPMAAGVDVISMHGLALARCLELCAAVDKARGGDA